MLSGWLLALTVAASPGQCGPGGCGVGGGMAFSPGMASGSFVAGQGGFSNPYDSVSAGGGGGGDQLYPFDSPEPWLHGYFQELPAHAGYSSFRPHNYKHVLAQMEVASRWGMSPVMAYSHQWYHKFRQRSGMHPNFGMGGSASLDPPSYGNVAQSQAPGMASDPYAPAISPASTRGQMSPLQQAAAFQRGYTGASIPGITTPYYQRTIPQPVEAVSPEYLDRMDNLQKQLEEQTFQMQLMQQRFQSQDKSQLPAWQQPNHMKFQNDRNQQVEEPRQLQQFAGAPAVPAQGYQEQRYQEQSAPGAFAQPAYGQTAPAPRSSGYPQGYGQPAPMQQPYPQPQPMYQPAPQYQNGPMQNGPQNYGVQPGYPQQGPAAAQPMNPTMTVPQGPIMQLPQGQAYFSSPQNTAPGYAMQSQQPIAGTHAVWQQNAGQPIGPQYAGQYRAAAPQQLVPQTQLIPQQPQFQQQPFQQLQYGQPGAFQQPAYQQMPAPQGPYYQ
jgi:hypothetical protein